jgi:hypothetical protein
MEKKQPTIFVELNERDQRGLSTTGLGHITAGDTDMQLRESSNDNRAAIGRLMGDREEQ